MATLQPLLDLLAECRADGRPALVLTRRRAAELVGTEPSDAWWAEHAADWRGAGFTAAFDPDRGWVTFTPLSPDAGTEPLDLRVVIRWVEAGEGPGLVRAPTGEIAARGDVGGAGGPVATTIWVSTRGDVGLDEPAALALALAVARFEQVGGGSGI